MGNNNEALVGTGKLVFSYMEDVETTEQKPSWGERPNGYIVLTPEGRWIVVQTAEGRKAPKTDENRAAAIRRIDPINRSAKPFCQCETSAVGLSRIPMARIRRVTMLP